MVARLFLPAASEVASAVRGREASSLFPHGVVFMSRDATRHDVFSRAVLGTHDHECAFYYFVETVTRCVTAVTVDWSTSRACTHHRYVRPGASRTESGSASVVSRVSRA